MTFTRGHGPTTSSILHRLDVLEQKVSKLMSDVPALDAALAALSPEVNAVVDAVKSIEAKLAAAGNPVDVSAEIAMVNAFHDSLAAAVAMTQPAPPPAPPTVPAPPA